MSTSGRTIEEYAELLGVPPDVSEEDLKKTWRKLSMQWHPDRNKDDPDAEERFKIISEAYEALKAARNGNTTSAPPPPMPPPRFAPGRVDFGSVELRHSARPIEVSIFAEAPLRTLDVERTQGFFWEIPDESDVFVPHDDDRRAPDEQLRIRIHGRALSHAAVGRLDDELVVVCDDYELRIGLTIDIVAARPTAPPKTPPRPPRTASPPPPPTSSWTTTRPSSSPPPPRPSGPASTPDPASTRSHGRRVLIGSLLAAVIVGILALSGVFSGSGKPSSGQAATAPPAPPPPVPRNLTVTPTIRPATGHQVTQGDQQEPVSVSASAVGAEIHVIWSDPQGDIGDYPPDPCVAVLPGTGQNSPDEFYEDPLEVSQLQPGQNGPSSGTYEFRFPAVLPGYYYLDGCDGGYGATGPAPGSLLIATVQAPQVGASTSDTNWADFEALTVYSVQRMATATIVQYGYVVNPDEPALDLNAMCLSQDNSSSHQATVRGQNHPIIQVSGHELQTGENNNWTQSPTKYALGYLVFSGSTAAGTDQSFSDCAGGLRNAAGAGINLG